MNDSQAEKIVRRSDRGEHPDAIAEALGVSLSTVYSVLRELRPKRKRKPRPCTSDIPDIIRALYREKKMKPRRISEVLGITRAYVYKCLQ